MFVSVHSESMGKPYVLIEDLRRENLFAQSFRALLSATVIQALYFIYISVVQLRVNILTPAVLAIGVGTLIHLPEF